MGRGTLVDRCAQVGMCVQVGRCVWWAGVMGAEYQKESVTSGVVICPSPGTQPPFPGGCPVPYYE